MKPIEIRRKIIEIAKKHNHGHIAPALSTVEILCSIDAIMEDNDKFIMSKGHACLALYAFLQLRGLNPNTECGHPEYQPEEGIECTTGSLGHGLPVAVGMAFAKKYLKQSGRVYVLLGDGECQEGTTWESLLLASHHNLDNLTIIIDRNKLQALDRTENVLSLENLHNMINSFQINIIELDDGHNIDSIINALKHKPSKKPLCIIANTIKGKGLPEAENKAEWHYRFPTEEEIEGMIL